jgi:hypothetical protein
MFAKRQAQGLERNIPEGPNDISIHFPYFYLKENINKHIN